MDLALAVLLLWGLLFTPIGLVLHWLVLGEGARVRALPLAPVTGVAFGFVVLAVLGRFGVEGGETWIASAFAIGAVSSVVAIWRGEIDWRSRELIGGGLLLLLAVTLIQLPVVGEPGDGPLGYGTAADPVEEVAAIDAAANGPASDLEVARDAAASADERPIAFEQFAAMTVAIGQTEDAVAPDAQWTAYGLHATMTGMLAALIALPLYGFARARGVRWLGLIVLVPLGVLAPAVFLALANGEGAAIASVPFTTAAVFSLLVTRRDRGWWALVVLFGAAIAASAGPLALLPLTAIGIAWMFLRSDTYEHLSQHDAPLAPARTLGATGITVVLGVLASLPLLLGGGELLAWEALHTTMPDALLSWPFAWLDSDLSTAGPEGGLEIAVWLIGPALLAVALIYAVVRNERRELGVLVGALAAATVAALSGLLETSAGIRLYEFTMLSASPFLAALAVRAVALARENADDLKGSREGRLAGVGPTALVVVFTLLCFSATTVTGTRMVHAPAVDFAAAAEVEEEVGASGSGGEQAALIAAGDPWLDFIIDGERVRGGFADPDAVSEVRNEYSEFGTRAEGYDKLVFSSSPLGSDPSLRYLEQSDLDAYQVRLFLDRTVTPTPRPDPIVDTTRTLQRARTQAADRAGAEDAGLADTAASTGNPTAPSPSVPVAGSAALGALRPFWVAQAHIAVEGAGENTPPDRPAGLLLPADDVTACPIARDELETTCEPTEPIVGPQCRARDIAAARSPIDRDGIGRRSRAAARPQVLTVDADRRLSRRPPLIGVQCFDVPLLDDSSVLLVHLRDIGLILPPEEALATGPEGAWGVEREEDRAGGAGGVGGGTMRTTSELDASLEYGGDRLIGKHDIVLEGDFGAGVRLSSGLPQIEGEDGGALSPRELAVFRGAADGFSSIARGQLVSGSIIATNTAGTDIRLGRLFARPRDLPPSCDVPIALAGGEQRELRLDMLSADGGPSVVRPGLTVSIESVSGSGAERVARVVVGTYLSKQGLPRYTLVDWTEQYEDELSVEGCDGTTHTEEGAASAAADTAASAAQLTNALGGDDES